MGLLSFLWHDSLDSQQEKHYDRSVQRMDRRGTFDSWFDLGTATQRGPHDTQRARAREVGEWHFWHRWFPPVDGHWVTDQRLDEHRRQRDANDGWTVQHDNFFTRRRH